MDELARSMRELRLAVGALNAASEQHRMATQDLLAALQRRANMWKRIGS